MPGCEDDEGPSLGAVDISPNERLLITEFDTFSQVLSNSDERSIEDFIADLPESEAIDSIVIVGHSDAREGEERESDLVLGRINAVLPFFERAFPDVSGFMAYGIGAEQPVADSDRQGEEGLNSRVEVHVEMRQ